MRAGTRNRCTATCVFSTSGWLARIGYVDGGFEERLARSMHNRWLAEGSRPAAAAADRRHVEEWRQLREETIDQ